MYRTHKRIEVAIIRHRFTVGRIRLSRIYIKKLDLSYATLRVTGRVEMGSLYGLIVACCLTSELIVYAGPVPQDFTSATKLVHVCDKETCVDHVLYDHYVEIEGNLDYKLKKIINDNPHIQILILEKPIACRGRKLRTLKCTLTLQTTEIGLHGIKITSFAKLMLQKRPTDLEYENMTHTFPCVITRRSGQTVCRRKLPSIARNGLWTVNVNEPTPLWTGPLQETPYPTLTLSGHLVSSHSDAPIAQGVRFNDGPHGIQFAYDKDNVDNLYGLTLAKCIHETGLYAGYGYVVSSRYNGMLNVEVYAGRTIKKHCINAILSVPDSTSQGKPKASVSWNAWISHDRRLVVDVSITDGETEDSKTCLESTRCYMGQVQKPQSEDRSDVERHTMAHRQIGICRRYTINYPADTLLTFVRNANKQQFEYRSWNKCSTEPTLCTLGSLAGACHVMLKEVSVEDATKLGETKGFAMDMWGLTYEGEINLKGFVVGTRGLLSMDFTVSVLGNDSLIEQPSDTFTCKPRLYDVASCHDFGLLVDNLNVTVPLPDGVQWLGNFSRNGMSVYYPFDNEARALAISAL